LAPPLWKESCDEARYDSIISMLQRSSEPCDVCMLCGRIVPRELITLHHLRPRQMGGGAEDRVPLCRPCHKQIHATFGNGELARAYADLGALRSAPQLESFLKWIRKQKSDRNFRTVTSDGHPGSKRQRMQQRRRARRAG
jgi:5-methylcytosine-specific restriction enzyme A